MKQILLVYILASSVLATARATTVEDENESNAMPEYYVQLESEVAGSSWVYLGCSVTRERCRKMALAKGYAESSATAGCTPHHETEYSCFAR